MENTPHKAGFVNIIGNPNVGKSTLMNAFVGERLSIITSKAQTTRHRILGIVNGDDFQMLLSDTPGIIKPAYQLQESMMDFVKSAFDDADVLLYIVELGEKELKDEAFFSKVADLSEKYSKDTQLRKMNGNRGSKHFLYINRTFFGLYNLMNDLGAKVLVNNYKTLKK